METTHRQESTYTVVINKEEQYSIWLSHKEIPLGWEEVGVTGNKSECLEYINKNWLDMRPLSLRVALDN